MRRITPERQEESFYAPHHKSDWFPKEADNGRSGSTGSARQSVAGLPANRLSGVSFFQNHFSEMATFGVVGLAPSELMGRGHCVYARTELLAVFRRGWARD